MTYNDSTPIATARVYEVSKSEAKSKGRRLDSTSDVSPHRSVEFGGNIPCRGARITHFALKETARAHRTFAWASPRAGRSPDNQHIILALERASERDSHHTATARALNKRIELRFGGAR